MYYNTPKTELQSPQRKTDQKLQSTNRLTKTSANHLTFQQPCLLIPPSTTHDTQPNPPCKKGASQSV